MKITTIFLGSALVASSLFAADNLAKAAKDAGLVALPTNQAALAKLAEETAIYAKDFPSTPERVELGKKYFLNLCFQKVELYHVIPVTI